MLFISTKTCCSSKFNYSKSSYQTPERHANKNKQAQESDAIIFASLARAQIIDIDTLIREDLLKKYKNLEKKYKESIDSSSSSKRNTVEKLEDSCENYRWYQDQQRIAGRPVLSVALSNSVIDQKTGKTMLHQLSKIGATHTISFLLEDTKDNNFNLLTKEGFALLDYAMSSQHALTVNFLLQHYTDSQRLQKNWPSFLSQAIKIQNEEIINIFIDREFTPRDNERIHVVDTKKYHNKFLFNRCERMHVDGKDEPIGLSRLIVEPAACKEKLSCAMLRQKEMNKKRIIQKRFDSEIEMISKPKD